MPTPSTIADIVAVQTPAQALADLLARAEAKLLNARGYEATRLARILLEIEADTSSTAQGLVLQIGAGGFLDPLPGVVEADPNPWLDLVAWGWFQEYRNAARATVLQLRLTDTAGGGPWPLSNPIAVAYPSSDRPLYYRSQAGSISVPRSGYVDAVFVAESMGSIYNVAPGQIVDLATPIPGVTVTSPAVGTTGSIILSAGADVESNASLRARLRDKWSLLGRGWMAATIRALARQALPGRTLRGQVFDPGPVPGVPDVYLADNAGPISAADALIVYNYLADRARKPVGNYPVRVYQATSLVVTLNATLYRSGSNPNAEALAAERLEAYAETLDLGMPVHVSRIVDTLVDPDSGVIGAYLPDYQGTEFITPAVTDWVGFTPVFTMV
jgi:hypothetical protein